MVDGKASLQNTKEWLEHEEWVRLKTNSIFTKSKGETERNGKAIWLILFDYQFNAFMYRKQFT